MDNSGKGTTPSEQEEETLPGVWKKRKRPTEDDTPVKETDTLPEDHDYASAPDPVAVDLVLQENTLLREEILQLKQPTEKLTLEHQFGIHRFAGLDSDIRFYTSSSQKTPNCVCSHRLQGKKRENCHEPPTAPAYTVQVHWLIEFLEDQLLVLSSTAVLPHARHGIPRHLRRRRRGSRAGALRRARRRCYNPVLTSVVMGNVRLLPNKMDELTVLTRHQREYRECSVMVFTETWLTTLTPDTLVSLDGFHLIRADRTAESGKKKGGGLALFLNDRWCNSGHITIKEQICCKDIELLAVSMRPCYLPREFSHAIMIAAYVPPSANADAACDVLHSAVCRLQTQHPQALLLVSGDFNHVSPPSTLYTFTQYVTCHTRDNKILDLFYANTKEAYNSSPLPPLGRSDHNLVHLLPVYKPLVHREPAVTRTVKKWSKETEEALKDCFESTVWEELSDPNGEDIDSLTNCITDYVNFCVENTVPTKIVRCFSNNKPWINPDIKALLKEKKRVFRSGDKDELKAVQRELRRKIREGKASYRRKLEEQLQQNNISGVWKGLKTISGHKKPDSQVVGDQKWVKELNLFFNRFDHLPDPPPAQTSLLNPLSVALPKCGPPPSLTLIPSTTFSSQPPPTGSFDCSYNPFTPSTQPPCSSLSFTTAQVRN
ncbi:hypothetical protein NFI96_009456 [Prochilodus magdalenae]|nr:hypothetical protein NFI96_009456 [Prochilodus magdalenae]